MIDMLVRCGLVLQLLSAALSELAHGEVEESIATIEQARLLFENLGGDV
jgi:hypothetical protein